MDLAIDGDDELVDEERARCGAGDSLGFLDRAAHAVLLRRQDQLRAEVLDDDLALVAGVLVDDDDDAVPAAGTRGRQSDAEVAAARGHDGAAGLQLPAVLGEVDRADRESVLHARRRVVVLELQ